MGGRTTVPRPAPVPLVKLDVSDEVAVGWETDDHAAGHPILRDNALGARLAPLKNVPGPGRELVLGLDFGTSSTKVVLADQSLNIGYAVPLVEAVGVNSYLLPSAMIETEDGFYVLSGHGHRHADLKLAMLRNMTDDTACARVCAFLALVIRSARAWLYETKSDQYLRADILWTLALGQPANPDKSNGSRTHFRLLAKVAWAIASETGPIRVEIALRTWRHREELDLGDELEVRAIAELSAQIHGFVSSSHFDARQPNIYLMVDVGAGTVDASLFRVRKDAGGVVSFALFTHSVELLGAASFNRYRVDWWQSQLGHAAQKLSSQDARRARLALAVKDGLQRLKLPTEYRGRYPNDYSSYVKGVQVGYQGGHYRRMQLTSPTSFSKSLGKFYMAHGSKICYHRMLSRTCPSFFVEAVQGIPSMPSSKTRFNGHQTVHGSARSLVNLLCRPISLRQAWLLATMTGCPSHTDSASLTSVNTCVFPL